MKYIDLLRKNEDLSKKKDSSSEPENEEPLPNKEPWGKSLYPRFEAVWEKWDVVLVSLEGLGITEASTLGEILRKAESLGLRGHTNEEVNVGVNALCSAAEEVGHSGFFARVAIVDPSANTVPCVAMTGSGVCAHNGYGALDGYVFQRETLWLFTRKEESKGASSPLRLL